MCVCVCVCRKLCNKESANVNGNRWQMYMFEGRCPSRPVRSQQEAAQLVAVLGCGGGYRNACAWRSVYYAHRTSKVLHSKAMMQHFVNTHPIWV